MAFVFILAVLWLKTGRVPAASGGDEVWMGEGAYWLLEKGVHRYDFLADEHEHQVVSTYQPVSAMFSALIFALFGMSPFTLMAQIPVAGTVIMVLLAAIGRRLGLAWWLSVLVPASVWGLMMVERRLNQVRWEPLVAMWVVLAFWLLLEARGADGWRRWILQALAGVASFLAGITYYPHGPFALLATTGAAFLLAGLTPWRSLPARLWAFVLGGVVSTVVFLSWLLRHYDYFHKQVVTFGDEHYFRLSNLAWPIVSLFRPEGMADWLALVEHAGVIALAALAAIVLKDPRWRAVAWVAVVMCGPVFLYKRPTMDVAGGIFGVLLLAGLASHFQVRWGRWPALAALWLLAVVAAGRFALFGYTAYAQADRRSYAIFQERLEEVLGSDSGKVASSQFTWLALRAQKGPGEYNFIAKYGDPSYDYRSTALRTREGIETHRHIIVAKGYDGLIRDHYPEMQAAIDDGTFVKIAEIEMPGPALPWSGAPIYDCTVYRNRKSLP